MPPSLDKTKMQPLQLVAKNIFGLRTNIVGNVHFSADQDVIYPVEGVLVIQDYVDRRQKFFRMTENFEPLFIVMSINRDFIAIIEKDVETNIQVSTYNLSNYKKILVIPLPESFNSKLIRHVCFSNDSKHLLILSAPPDELIHMVSMEKEGSIAEFRATIPALADTTICLGCHPKDSEIVVTAGKNLFTFLKKNEKGTYTVMDTIECKFFIKSVAFLTNDVLLMGTNKNELIVVENRVIRFTFKASEFEILDLELEKLPAEKEITFEIGALFDQNVINLTCFSKGFAYVICNYVFVFEKVVDLVYERKTIIEIPITIYPEKLYQITNMTIDPKEEVVLVTAKHSQIYAAVLIVPEALKTKHLHFTPLGELIHIDEIIDVSLCSWKPIIITASKDRTVRIWNYETVTLELVRIYQVNITVVELSSTGLMAAIGFPNELKVCQIFLDELNIVKSYPFPACKDVKYSNFGHLMAAAYENTVDLCSTYNLEILHSLKGHSTPVNYVIFTHYDNYVFSSSTDGVIFQWDVVTGEKIKQISHNGVEFTTIAVTTSPDPLILYAGTTDGSIYVFEDGKFKFEIPLPAKQKSALSAMCLESCDLIFYVANNVGNLFSVNVPFDKSYVPGCFDPYLFFISGITNLRFTYDGNKLVVTSKSGTLGIWEIKNAEKRLTPIDRDLLKSHEILISRHILEEKNNHIKSLEAALKKQAEQYQQIMEQNQISDGHQLAEVHKTYCEALGELRDATATSAMRNKEHLENVYEQISEMTDHFRKGLEQLSHQYSERMLIEFEKFNKLRNSMLELRETYENQVKISGFILKDSTDDLQEDFIKKMDERRDLIVNLMQEIEANKEEFMDYCHQVEDQTDREVIMKRIDYEKKITKQAEIKQIWCDRATRLEEAFQDNSNKLFELDSELDNMKQELAKTMQQIDKANNHVENLRKDVSVRDTAIAIKEKRIMELLHKNKELEKYKGVLQYKINAIKETIEPRLEVIVDKSKHISELQAELDGLRTNNLTFELQLRELRDKYLSKKAELDLETFRLKGCQRCTQDICQEIYSLNYITDHCELVSTIKEIFLRHSSDDELKKYLSYDATLYDYYARQRANMERILKIYRKNVKTTILNDTYEKYSRQNRFLRRELRKLKAENAMYVKRQEKESLLKTDEKKELLTKEGEKDEKPQKINIKTD